MIDEHHQDLAAEYALDALDPESARAFETMLANDAELKALADDMRETAATLALDAPAHLPPPELRERILSSIRAEAQGGAPAATISTAEPSLVAPVPSGGGRNILPWAIAAGFAITTAALWFERSELQQDRVSLLQEIKLAHERDVFAKMKIATLAAQVDAYSQATAVIVWDAEKQHGVVKLTHIPPAGAGKDYQLWVIDPKYPAPVNGGLVPVNAEGIARVSFTPDQPISKADKFAISLEPAGGVPKATGPIVLLGGN